MKSLYIIINILFASISLTLVFIWNICFLTFLVLAYLTPRQLQVIPLLVVLFVNQAIHQLSFVFFTRCNAYSLQIVMQFNQTKA